MEELNKLVKMELARTGLWIIISGVLAVALGFLLMPVK